MAVATGVFPGKCQGRRDFVGLPQPSGVYAFRGQFSLKSGPELVIAHNAAKRAGETEPCQCHGGVRRCPARSRGESLRRFESRRAVRDDEVDENFS